LVYNPVNTLLIFDKHLSIKIIKNNIVVVNGWSSAGPPPWIAGKPVSAAGAGAPLWACGGLALTTAVDRPPTTTLFYY
jgi:hypothetical protein